MEYTPGQEYERGVHGSYQQSREGPSWKAVVNSSLNAALDEFLNGDHRQKGPNTTPNFQIIPPREEDTTSNVHPGVTDQPQDFHSDQTTPQYMPLHLNSCALLASYIPSGPGYTYLHAPPPQAMLAMCQVEEVKIGSSKSKRIILCPLSLIGHYTLSRENLCRSLSLMTLRPNKFLII